MTLRIAGKQMDIGEAFRIRIKQRIGEAVGKYFDGGFAGHVTVEKTGSRFGADCLLHLDTGTVLQAGGEAQDPNAAFDVAAERIEKRLRRYKRRLKEHPVGSGDGFDIAYRVVEPMGDDEEDAADDSAPTIVAESKMPLRTMSVASAVVELDLTDRPVFVFRSPGSSAVNIVYRRADGNIGWIDPSAADGG